MRLSRREKRSPQNAVVAGGVAPAYDRGHAQGTNGVDAPPVTTLRTTIRRLPERRAGQPAKA